LQSAPRILPRRKRKNQTPSNPSQPAAAIGAELHQLKLDPDACYRVRDLALERPDIRFFFTDGWLIFARPVAGHRIAALYSARESTDDAGNPGPSLQPQ